MTYTILVVPSCNYRRRSPANPSLIIKACWRGTDGTDVRLEHGVPFAAANFARYCTGKCCNPISAKTAGTSRNLKPLLYPTL